METAGQVRPSPLEVGRWLQDNRSEAERWLPRLLDLSGPMLSRELADHPELQPGLAQLLLGVADDLAERYPIRAHELTTAVIAYVASNRSLPHARMAPYLLGQAWATQAAALRGVGRHGEALAAVAAARDAYATAHVTAWHIAVAEVIEAQILHEMGERAEALRLMRRAAEVILLHGAVERYVEVRMHEARMLCDAGDRVAAAQVWRTTAREAAERRDTVFMAFLENAVGGFQLRHGGADAAARRFEVAHDVFDTAGLTREGVRARRGVAEAAVARGRFHDAISEYYKVQGLLLAAGNLLDAAVASAEIVELLLIVGRHREILPLAALLVRTLADGANQSAAHAWRFVEEHARAGDLTRDAIVRVRRFLQDLPLQPNARFE